MKLQVSENWLDNKLAALREKNLFREIPDELPEGVIDFSSNNYLGLTRHPVLQAAAIHAIEKYGTGSGASRLISGTKAPHRQLERRLAEWYKRESALLFNSGYQAGVGLIPAIADRGVIFSDELNHACLIDGCRLSRAHVAVYRHQDMEHLEQLLNAHSDSFPRWIVSESVFSMEGTKAPVLKLIELKQKYNAFLMMDEAHAIGVYGSEGRGWADARGGAADVDLIMGTFSKALGSFGAFAVGSKQLMTWIANTARSFIFTTALPPSVAAVNEAAIELIRTMDGERVALRRASKETRSFLNAQGWETRGDDSPIIPVIVGEEEKALQLSRMLLEQGLWIRAIRPPTVPPGTSRLRISLSASHSTQHLEKLRQALIGDTHQLMLLINWCVSPISKP